MGFAEEKPIYLQVAQKLEDAILAGAFSEEEQIPSTTEISVTYRINPATALKGVNILVDDCIIYKRRGLGMFVCPGAKEIILSKRRQLFYDTFIASLLREAEKLGISREQVVALIQEESKNEPN